MSRTVRISILLAVLVVVAGMTFFERLWVRSWSRPLEMAIYPVAADAASAAYVARLQDADFEEIATYLAAEARNRWHREIPAPRIVLRAPLAEPPAAPQGREPLDVVRFTLKLRWFAFRRTPFWKGLGAVRMFVLYHELRPNEALPHSLGLQKGLIGVAHVFADDAQRARNNVVIAHELLHTLGATDKYDAGDQPLDPLGLADPYAEPRYPQHRAEIMAGRIALSPGRSEMPRDLGETVIGYATAAEIGW